MSLPTLYTLAAEYRQHADQLADLDVDEATLADTLESLQWPIDQKVRTVAAVIGNMESAAAVIKEHAKRKMAEGNSAKARADRLRKYLLDNMIACEITEISATDGSLTIRVKQNPESVVIDDESLIPDDLFASPEPQPKTPDKVAIKTAIKAGRDVQGAHIERGMRVEIK